MLDAYLTALGLSEDMAEIANSTQQPPNITNSSDSPNDQETQTSPRILSWRGVLVRFSLAALILLSVGGVAFWLGQRTFRPQIAELGGERKTVVQNVEPLIAGHAMLRQTVDVIWADASPKYREGDVISNGKIQFERGVAEIDFFCGATLIVEGPATLDIESDWSVQVLQGRLRASVPPAARGFIIKAAGTEVVDLGTEFALDVESQDARVEVIDGEVELRGGEFDGTHLTTGQRQWLRGKKFPGQSFDGLSTLGDVHRRRQDAQAQRFADWKKFAQHLSADPRLIAYYPIANTSVGRVIANTALTGSWPVGLTVWVAPKERAASSL